VHLSLQIDRKKRQKWRNAMKKFLLGTVGLIALGIAPASAADVASRPYAAPAPYIQPVYDWSGFYIGGNAGGGWSHNCWDVTNFVTPRNSLREGCHDATGAVAGGQIGYRWQNAGWVFGLEAQGDWADLTSSNVSFFIPNWTNNTKVEALGLFTGQVGYAWNNFLWYVKGGAAVTDSQFQGTVTTSGRLFDTVDNTRWGGVIGTGVEVGFAPNWSVALEYDHLFMGNQSVTTTSQGVLGGIPAGSVFRTDSIHQDIDMVTARINYHFNWGGGVARY
jgi:outer membrane immunogenic protein